MATHQASSGTKPRLHNSFYEQLKDTVTQEPARIASGVANSILGRGNVSPSEHGDMPPMSPEFMSPFLKKKERAPEIRVFAFRERQENLNVQAKIEELMKVIRRLVIEIERDHKNFLSDAAKITVEQLPEKPGIYHVHFLEWVVRTLRDLKKKVSESATWFSMVMGKRKKMGYWGMFKKHGTTFGMSGERSAATQSG